MNLRTTLQNLFVLSLIVFSLGYPYIVLAQDTIVTISDAGLRTAIETKLGKAPGADITEAEMATLDTLEARSLKIQSLTGLSTAINLQELRLSGNNISDISELASLTQLQVLHISDNQISDISALAGLTQLESLSLNMNPISDLSFLSDLTNLKFLYLEKCSLSDISPLMNNIGLNQGDKLALQGNRLNYTSLYSDIPALQDRGVEVVFTERTLTFKSSTTDLVPQILSGTLEGTVYITARDEKGFGFEGIPVTFTVTTGEGTLSTTDTVSYTHLTLPTKRIV